MKKIPYGISNYEQLIQDGYFYIDKTKYIEKLEEISEKNIVILRPRKFGKTLFTSMLENYYDKNKKNKFEEMYKNTYIGKNSTALKNTYSILRFNFSGIDTSNEIATLKSFKYNVMESIRVFVGKYNLDFYINEEMDAEDILNSLFTAFLLQKNEEKIYVIIDEYDHFANELLSFNIDQFKKLISKNGKVRKWYEVLKKGTETVVDRIFITGVSPITFDSLTSGFNIGRDITQDERFNEMIGFTQEEVCQLLKEQEINENEQLELLPVMKDNYDGYKFSLRANEKMYNSNMCLYFMLEYLKNREMPIKMVDTNIASDYSKIGKMLELCKGEKRFELLKKSVSGERIVCDIVQKFNPAMEFTETDMLSMLFYLGYLTIDGDEFEIPILKIPNKSMKEIYSDYLMKLFDEKAEYRINEEMYAEILREIATEGKIDKIVSIFEKYLNNLSNRDFIKFDEKYVKLIFYCISMNLRIYAVKSEMEVNRNYPDILLIPRDRLKNYNSVMIEFKYLKKNEKRYLKDKQKEAREQIERYRNFEDIKDIRKLNCYTIVVVNNEVFIERI